jgi:hypothetical protein
MRRVRQTGSQQAMRGMLGSERQPHDICDSVLQQGMPAEAPEGTQSVVHADAANQRAASVFQGIFEHFLALTFPNHHLPKQITEENGMVVMKFESYRTTSPFKNWARIQFPHDLAPSRDAARVALMHSRCGDPLSYARTLFEILIRRKFPSQHPFDSF